MTDLVLLILLLALLVLHWIQDRLVRRWRREAEEAIRYWRGIAASKEAEAKMWELKAHAAARGWHRSVRNTVDQSGGGTKH